MTRRTDTNKTARENKKYQINTQRHGVSIPPRRGKRLGKKQKERQTNREREYEALRENTKRQLNERPRATQQILTQYFQPEPENETNLFDNLIEGETPIEPMGDILIEKEDYITRFGAQNIMGLSIKEGHDILPETVSIHALELDYVGLTEPNRVMTKATKQ